MHVEVELMKALKLKGQTAIFWLHFMVYLCNLSIVHALKGVPFVFLYFTSVGTEVAMI